MPNPKMNPQVPNIPRVPPIPPVKVREPDPRITKARCYLRALHPDNLIELDDKMKRAVLYDTLEIILDILEV